MFSLAGTDSIISLHQQRGKTPPPPLRSSTGNGMPDILTVSLKFPFQIYFCSLENTLEISLPFPLIPIKVPKITLRFLLGACVHPFKKCPYLLNINNIQSDAT